MRVGNCGQWVRVVPAMLVAGALLVFGAGVASALPTVNCDLPGGSAAFQTALAAGGTVFVSGTCDGDFTASANVTVTGSPTATLDGQGTGRTLVIGAGKVVTLNNLTVTGGNASAVGPAGSGGGILNNWPP